MEKVWWVLWTRSTCRLQSHKGLEGMHQIILEIFMMDKVDPRSWCYQNHHRRENSRRFNNWIDEGGKERVLGNQELNGLMSSQDKVKWFMWNCRKQLIIIRCLSSIFKEMRENLRKMKRRKRRRKRLRRIRRRKERMMVVKILVTLN